MEPSEKENLFLYLDQILDLESKKLVGKLLKRFELFFSNNEDADSLSKILSVFKKEIKELVYESSRETRDIFYAYSNGLETSHFNFVKKEE